MANTYPKGYRAVHLRPDIYEALLSIKELEGLSPQYRIKELIRFYKAYKGVVKCLD